jgi:hypothetical protein
MNVEMINPKYPVWSITDMELTQLDYRRGESKGYPGRYHLDIVSPADDINQFVSEWCKQYADIIRIAKSDNIELWGQIWKHYADNISISENVEFTADEPGFAMGPHTDNRWIVAVLIINLVDNPGGSTNFPHLDWQASDAEGDGVFFLNHINTAHSIDWQGTTDRWIAYHTITIEDIYENINTGR